MSTRNSTTKRPSMGHITTRRILGDRMRMILGARTQDLTATGRRQDRALADLGVAIDDGRMGSPPNEHSAE